MFLISNADETLFHKKEALAYVLTSVLNES